VSTTTAPSSTPYVHWLIESRPASLTWSRPAPPQSNQPPLDLLDHEGESAEAAALHDRGVRLSTVGARWAARPRPGLPDAKVWSARLALAVIQTLLGQRPVAQAIHSKGGPESLQLHALTAHCDLDRTSTPEEALVGKKYGAGKDFGLHATVKRSEALLVLTQRSEGVARISHKGPLLVVAAAADGGLGRDRRTDRRADRRTGCVVRRRSPAPLR
jgi:hypothetical protein